MDGKLKGSYTVEMSMLGGLWLFVVFASLLLLMGTYGKIWDTAKACELAVHASTASVCKNINGIEKAKEMNQKNGDSYEISGSKREITVSFDYTLKIPFQNLSWRRNYVVKSKVIRPVLFIEKVEKARKLLGKE